MCYPQTMRRFLLTFALVPVLGLFLSCNKPPLEDCRKACWNAYSIRFWGQVDTKVATLSPDEAAKYRAIKELEFQKTEEREEDQGYMNCVSQCHSEGTNEAVKCMIAATTEAQVKVCLEK